MLLYVAQDTEFLPALLPARPPPALLPSAASAGAAAESDMRVTKRRCTAKLLTHCSTPLLGCSHRTVLHTPPGVEHDLATGFAVQTGGNREILGPDPRPITGRLKNRGA